MTAILTTIGILLIVGALTAIFFAILVIIQQLGGFEK
jgi:hypothetical protein